VLNKEIKIAIIGAGWFGCHIGYNLKKKILILKYLKKIKIFLRMLLVTILIDYT
tara:strand:- start:721 stop:882 length:162 start_codon:yes stop_codon:yes gene_type:complete